MRVMVSKLALFQNDMDSLRLVVESIDTTAKFAPRTLIFKNTSLGRCVKLIHSTTKSTTIEELERMSGFEPEVKHIAEKLLNSRREYIPFPFIAGPDWLKKYLTNNNFSKKRICKFSEHILNELYRPVLSFICRYARLLKLFKYSPENIFNIDQTRMDAKHSNLSTIGIIGEDHKLRLPDVPIPIAYSAAVGASADGTALPTMIVVKGSLNTAGVVHKLTFPTDGSINNNLELKHIKAETHDVPDLATLLQEDEDWNNSKLPLEEYPELNAIINCPKKKSKLSRETSKASPIPLLIQNPPNEHPNSMNNSTKPSAAETATPTRNQLNDSRMMKELNKDMRSKMAVLFHDYCQKSSILLEDNAWRKAFETDLILNSFQVAFKDFKRLDTTSTTSTSTTAMQKFIESKHMIPLFKEIIEAYRIDAIDSTSHTLKKRKLNNSSINITPSKNEDDIANTNNSSNSNIVCLSQGKDINVDAANIKSLKSRQMKKQLKTNDSGVVELVDNSTNINPIVDISNSDESTIFTSISVPVSSPSSASASTTTTTTASATVTLTKEEKLKIKATAKAERAKIAAEKATKRAAEKAAERAEKAALILAKKNQQKNLKNNKIVKTGGMDTDLHTHAAVDILTNTTTKLKSQTRIKKNNRESVYTPSGRNLADITGYSQNKEIDEVVNESLEDLSIPKLAIEFVSRIISIPFLADSILHNRYKKIITSIAEKKPLNITQTTLEGEINKCAIESDVIIPTNALAQLDLNKPEKTTSLSNVSILQGTFSRPSENEGYYEIYQETNVSSWFNQEVVVTYIIRVILPRSRISRKKGERILITLDCLHSHISDTATSLLGALNIDVLYIPRFTTPYLQPMDVGVNAPLKKNLRKIVTMARHDGINMNNHTNRVKIMLMSLQTISKQTVINSFRKTFARPFEIFNTTQEISDDFFETGRKKTSRPRTNNSLPPDDNEYDSENECGEYYR